MTTTEFQIDLTADNEGLGALFITDPSLLIRPAVPGQYPPRVKHDSAHAYRVLNLGNNGGLYRWHIICQTDPRHAHQLLDRVFYAYVGACCFELWCDARVCYIVDGETVQVSEYGFNDGQYTMIFNVYCNVTDADALLSSLTSSIDEDERFVVVHPDSSEFGFTTRGFTVDISEEVETDEPDDYGIDESCDGGCGQPVYACTCAEVEAFRRHNADPDTAGSWFVV